MDALAYIERQRSAQEPQAPNATPGWRRVRLGKLFADALSRPEAIDMICERARNGGGGFVVTPNLDHLCLAERLPALRAAYDETFLSLVDGMPLVWWAKWMGQAFPEKVSGSDLLLPLCEQAAARGLRVFFLGAPPGVARRAAERLTKQIPALQVCGTLSPPLGFEDMPDTAAWVQRCVQQAKPNLVFVALGCPKQETWMRTHYRSLAPALLLGVGAAIEFVAGTKTRAPQWVSEAGLEWLHRLSQDPKRLWHRYLVRDATGLSILLRSLRMPPEDRSVFCRASPRTEISV